MKKKKQQRSRRYNHVYQRKRRHRIRQMWCVGISVAFIVIILLVGWLAFTKHKRAEKEVANVVMDSKKADEKKESKESTTTQKETETVTDEKTLYQFLKTSLEPVGSTMYIWGGGWNKEDTGAGEDARRIGVNPQWKIFYEQQDASYDFNNYRYAHGNGLDCSGYVGWVIYNLFETEDGKAGYVDKASKMAQNFANLGFGTYIYQSDLNVHKPGDICSSTCGDCGHIFIVLGQCEDGSVVLVHSSPPGVKISGTPAADGTKESKAATLAAKYMKAYYPDWYARYPDCTTDISYLSHYSCMRFRVSKGSVVSDPEGIQNMSAEEVLKMLFK